MSERAHPTPPTPPRAAPTPPRPRREPAGSAHRCLSVSVIHRGSATPPPPAGGIRTSDLGSIYHGRSPFRGRRQPKNSAAGGARRRPLGRCARGRQKAPTDGHGRSAREGARPTARASARKATRATNQPMAAGRAQGREARAGRREGGRGGGGAASSRAAQSAKVHVSCLPETDAHERITGSKSCTFAGGTRAAVRRTARSRATKPPPSPPPHTHGLGQRMHAAAWAAILHGVQLT